MSFNDWESFFAKIPFTFFRTSQIQQKYIELINKYTSDGGALLEIAAGSGYTTAVVADLVRTKNAIVTFSDLSENLVNLAQSKFRGFTNLTFATVDSSNITFDNNSFDVLFSQGFFEHFDEVQIIKFLKEQARVSKFVIFDVPNSKRWNKTQEYGNEIFYSNKQWRKLVHLAGLTIVEQHGRRFNNGWKKFVPVVIQQSNWFGRYFGESTIIVCKKASWTLQPPYPPPHPPSAPKK